MRYVSMLFTFLLAMAFIPNTMADEGPDPKRTFSVSGKVIDQSSQEALQYATVKLLQPGDSSLVTGIVTDRQGRFTIETKEPGDYILQVNFIGYQKKTRNVSLSKANRSVELGTIGLPPATQNIDE